MGLWAALFGKKKKTAQEMAARMNREFRERIEREEKMPILEDGTPNSHWYAREADRLSGLDRNCQAAAILEKGIELCRRAELDACVALLEKRLVGVKGLIDLDQIGEEVVAFLKSSTEGCKQTDLYNEFPERDTETLRHVCYRLADAGRIIREKAGRSYMLRLPEQNKLE